VDTPARSVLVEANRRLGASWKLNLEARGFSNQAYVFIGLQNDGCFRLELAYHF